LWCCIATCRCCRKRSLAKLEEANKELEEELAESAAESLKEKMKPRKETKEIGEDAPSKKEEESSNGGWFSWGNKPQPEEEPKTNETTKTGSWFGASKEADTKPDKESGSLFGWGGTKEEKKTLFGGSKPKSVLPSKTSVMMSVVKLKAKM